MQRPRPSIRAATSAALIAVGVLSLGVVAGLVWTSALLQRATDDVRRDTRSAALAQQIELDLLAYQRVSNLYSVYGEPGLEPLRESLEGDVETGLREARARSGGETEDALIDDVSRAIDAYMEERGRLERRGLPVRDVIGATRAPLDEAISKLALLRDLNDAEVERALAGAARVDAVANIAGIVAGALLLLGLTAVAVGVHTRIVIPLLELHRTITAFRRGDRGARADERGPRELIGVARAFNAMQDALLEQRKNQFAFLTGVAHDLRNPIAALRMSASLLAEEPSPEDRKKTVAIVDRQLESLRRMVDDLIDASRIEAGELELSLVDVDLVAIAGAVVELYAPTSATHDIALDAPPGSVVVRADAMRLEQAVGNLVNNAIKYSPKGGPIGVSVAQERGEAVLRVTDQGIGIAEEDLDTIFAPFRRRAPGVAGGIGLGLSIVRRIVEAHGGRVEVESTLGRGCRFELRLPLPQRVPHSSANLGARRPREVPSA